MIFIGIFEFLQGLVTLLFIDISDDIRSKVDDLFQFFDRNIEKESCTRRYGLQIPYMSDRSSELDMTSSLTADLTRRDFYATSFADDTLVSDSLILTAGTLIILSRTKYLFTEKSSTFWTLSTIVYRFRNEYFPIRESSYIFLSRKSYSNCSEIIEIFTDRNISFSCESSYLGVVSDFIIEKILKIFCHWKHSWQFLEIRI